MPATRLNPRQCAGFRLAAQTPPHFELRNTLLRSGPSHALILVRSLREHADFGVLRGRQQEPITDAN